MRTLYLTPYHFLYQNPIENKFFLKGINWVLGSI